MKKLLIVPMLCLIAYAAYAVTVPFVIQVGAVGDFTFAPPTGSVLHFMAPAGHDTCDGLGTSTGTVNPCAWLTPNHAMKCGEVILAQAGTYSQGMNSWGTVSNCPSTTGGIDGTGGIYFATLLCAGSSVGDCKINNTTCCSRAMQVTSNNWAIEGWWAAGNGTDRAFIAGSDNLAAQSNNHIAFINDMATNQAQGYVTGGNDSGTHTPAGKGLDYVAIVGSIAQNAAQDGICLGAVDIIVLTNSDTVAGTHIFVNGNFSFANLVTCASDGEAYLIDTIDAHSYSSQIIISNNIGYYSARFGLMMFYQTISSTTPTIKAYNNTFYNDMQKDSGGEFTVQSTGSSLPWVISIFNNVALATAGGGGGIDSYAIWIGGNYASTTVGGTGIENIAKGQNSACIGSSCDSGNNVVAFNSGSFGTNFYANPSFTNTTDLMANHIGAPSCSGFTNTTACLGWDATTGTLTTSTIISDLVAGCAQCGGKGYQLSSTTCASNTDYPAYLKGVVYLHASGFTAGATITEKAGLVTKPCNM